MLRHVVAYYNKDKTIKNCESWTQNGLYHREGGPAIIQYYKNGSVDSELYYIKGQRHREDGAAVIWYYRDGSIWYEYYYLNGRQYTQEEWFNTLSTQQKIDYLLKG